MCRPGWAPATREPSHGSQIAVSFGPPKENVPLGVNLPAMPSQTLLRVQFTVLSSLANSRHLARRSCGSSMCILLCQEGSWFPIARVEFPPAAKAPICRRQRVQRRENWISKLSSTQSDLTASGLPTTPTRKPMQTGCLSRRSLPAPSEARSWRGTRTIDLIRAAWSSARRRREILFIASGHTIRRAGGPSSLRSTGLTPNVGSTGEGGSPDETL